MNTAEVDLHVGSEPQLLPKKKVRDANIELGRICCFASIAGAHIFPYYVRDFDTVSKAGTIVGVACKMFATPFFFLTMGAFMSSGTPYRRSLARVIKKVAIPFIFTFFLILQSIPLIKKETGVLGTLTRLHVDLGEYFHALAAVFFENYDYTYHLWFIGAIFLCYLLLPIFRIFLYDSSINKLYKVNVVVLGIIVFIIPQTLKTISTDIHIHQMTIALPPFPLFWIWLLLLGSYIHGWLKENRDAVESCVIWLAPLVFMAFLMINYYCAKKYDLTTNGVAFAAIRENVVIFIPNILPFLWFRCVHIRNATVGKAILFISNKCFYMYVVHVPIMGFFYNYVGLGNRIFFINYFLNWLFVVFLSFAVACLLKFIERSVYFFAMKLWSKIVLDVGLLTPIFRRGMREGDENFN